MKNFKIQVLNHWTNEGNGTYVTLNIIPRIWFVLWDPNEEYETFRDKYKLVISLMWFGFDIDFLIIEATYKTKGKKPTDV